jgi:hypothetical protein
VLTLPAGASGSGGGGAAASKFEREIDINDAPMRIVLTKRQTHDQVCA